MADALANAAVEMILEPSERRQLGEQGLIVLWRDGREPGLRKGLACVLSMCPHPQCTCQIVYMDGYVIDRQAQAVIREGENVYLRGASGESEDARIPLQATMIARVDPKSGETTAHPDKPGETDPALIEWLASEMDGELLDLLHRYRTRTKGLTPEGPRKDIDLEDVEQYHLVEVCQLLDGIRSDEYLLGGRRYWTAMFLCPTPGCDCHAARIVFFEEGMEEGKDIVGSVLLDLSGRTGFKIEEMTAETAPRKLVRELWALFERRHDVRSYLLHREAQLREAGRTLWGCVPKQVIAAPAIGRNDPCPCGSGRKYKKCCLGKGAVQADAGGVSGGD